jgi:hypothetical protein
MASSTVAEIQAKETPKETLHRWRIEHARRCGAAARTDSTKEHQFHDPELRAAYNAAKRGES